jgi:hypothetical protein
MPDSSNVCSLEAVLYYAWEREVIRIVKERGSEKPWTKDPVLAKYKFTNIHRRDDRVSRWIIEHIIEPFEKRDDLWFTLLIARLVNWPPTLQHLLDEGVLPCSPVEFSPTRFSESVEKFRASGAKSYSGAYMVYPTRLNNGGVKSMALAKYIITPTVVLGADLSEIVCGSTPSVGSFVTVLSNSFGISTFMAGQVAADLTYSSYHLGPAQDLYTFAPIGPGSSAGLNLMLGKKETYKWGQDEFNMELIKVRTAIIDKLDIEDLTLHDVQNIMCEYSKYCRAVLGKINPKNIYTPEMEF